MAFTRPSLTTIIARIEGDFKTGLSLPTILIRSFEFVFARAYAAVANTLHGHIDFAINKLFFLIDGIEKTVIRWGTLFAVLRKVAVKTEFIMDATSTTGGTLTVGTIYVRSDGTEYLVKTEVILPASSTLPVTVVAGDGFEGADFNVLVGDTLSLQSAIAGINSDATVTSIVIEGENLELLEDYRTRVEERIQQPPAGGKVTDYIAFAKKIAGVTRAWVLPGNVGEGTVGVTFVEDGNAPASIIPSPAKVAEVATQILIDEPQGTGGSNVFAPNELVMDPVIQIKPDTTTIRAAVTAELEDLLAREAQVRGGVDPDNVGLGLTFNGKIKISQINEAISIAAGETDHVLISPTSDVQPISGGIVTLGTPVYSTLP